MESIKPTKSVSCETATPWLNGAKFKKYLQMNSFNGLSGHIQFDKTTGLRQNLTLAIVDNIKNSVDLVRIWFKTITPEKNNLKNII